MRMSFFLFLLLIVIPAGMPLSASDFFTKFTSMDEDLTQSAMVYELCNPLKEELYLLKASTADYYAEAGAKNIPDIGADIYQIEDERPVYEPVEIKLAVNETYSVPAINASITGYEKYFRNLTEKDFLKPEACATMRLVSTTEPRYKMDAVDVVPVLDLAKADVSAESLKAAEITNEKGEASTSVAWKAREWVNITFLNRTWIWVNNSNSYDFSALPVELNISMPEADADGHDIRLACDDRMAAFAYQALGSQRFALRFHAKLKLNSINKSCYAYWNPTKSVKNVSADWKAMYWNLWFNATENYWNWQDLLQYETNWYATVAPAGVGGASNTVASSQFAITAPTNTRPNPTFTGINIPNRAFIHIWSLDNDTSQQSGVIFGEADAAQAPYTSYQVTAQKQTGTTGRIILREFTTGGSGTIIASNSTTNKHYNGYVHTDIFWTPNSAIYVRTHYLNGTLMQVLNFTDVSIAQGLLGFNEEAGAYYHALGYRQFARSGVRASTHGNETYTPVMENASAENVDISWGDPSQQYCADGSTLRQYWSVVINGVAYTKQKDITCSDGCVTDRCAVSQTWWWLALGAFLLVVLLLLFLKNRI